MITLYGIPNCDTMKKARTWLDKHGVDYRFHDYKKEGVPAKALQQWIKQAGIDVLVNRRGTTWRKLPDADKEGLNNKTAARLMQDNPSLIKRPVLDIDGEITVGFSDGDYKALFK